MRGDRGSIDHLAAMKDEEFEKGELLRRELDGLSGALHTACVERDFEIGNAHEPWDERRLAPCQRANAGDQLPKGERLGDIVVGADLESNNAVVHRIPCG